MRWPLLQSDRVTYRKPAERNLFKSNAVKVGKLERISFS